MIDGRGIVLVWDQLRFLHRAVRLVILTATWYLAAAGPSGATLPQVVQEVAKN